MGFRDFIKALASNPNVVDDETVNEELEEFLAENKESVSRVRSMEEKYAVDAAAIDVVKVTDVLPLEKLNVW